jgi:hypothetical protein
MRGKFRLGGVFVLLLMAGVVVYWLAAPAPEDAAAVAPAAGEKAPVEARAAPAPMELERGAERGEVVEVATAAAAPAHSSVEAPQPTLALHGRVVVTGADGRVRNDLEGELTLGLWHAGSGRSEQVRFVGGEWSASFDAAQPIVGLSVERLFVGGRFAVVDEPSKRVDVPSSGDFTIRAHLPPAVVLRVIDSASRSELHGVSLVRADSFPSESARHPGLEFEERIVATGLASPIDVGAYAQVLGPWGSTRLLVGVRGHAWSLVDVDFAHGGERTVALERGAELTVLVRGVDPRADERLRLRLEDVFPPVLELALTGDGEIALDALAPGEVRVAAEIGTPFEEPIVVGEATVVLRAGERASVTLDLAPAPRSELADVAGVVFVAKGWERTSLDASLELIGTALGGLESRRSLSALSSQSTREGYDEFRWACANVQVGRHEFDLAAPPFTVVLDVPPGGRDDYELVLDAPVELLVLVVDDATGEPVATDQLNWHPRRPEGVTAGGLERARFDAERGRHVIRAVPTIVELMLWSNEHLPYSGEVDLTRGVREHTIRLQRASSIEVTLSCAGTRLPLPEGWYEQPSEPISGGATRLTSFNSWSRTFVVTTPGVYELVAPKIPGYRELPLQRIEVFAGRKTEHVIEYEPERP